MEALVILLAEFLIVLLIPALIVAAQVAVLLLSLLLDLVVLLCFGRRRVVPSSTGTPVGPPKRSWKNTVQSWGAAAWRIRKAALIGLALTVGVLGLANTVFFEPTVRLLLVMVGQRTGTELEFKSVSGNLFAGRFAFEELSARRISDTKSSFDLRVRGFSMHLDLMTLLAPPIIFNTLSAHTVTGTFRQPERTAGGNGRGNSGERLEVKRKFRVENLILKDVNVALSRGEAAAVAVSLESVASAPFHSNFAVFDTLFRSNVIGQIDGHDISISMRRTDGGRVTQWRMFDIPAASVSRFVTRPPIGWLREGVLNVSVDDRWELGERAAIDMDWNIRLESVHAEAGEAAGAIERALAVPIVSYINSRQGNLDLRFRVVMDESKFENAASLDTRALWDEVLQSMASSIAIGAGEETKNVRQHLDKAVEGFEGFLDRRRKPPGE